MRKIISILLASVITLGLCACSSTKSSKGIYDLSNMTAEETTSEVIYYIDNRPQQGDTYEAIQARFKTTPTEVKIIDEVGVYSQFNTQYSTEDIFYERNISVNQDQIIFIKYTNAKKAMNGSTVDVSNEHIGVYICFVIVDYTKAEEIFTAIGNYFNSNSQFTNVSIDRDSGNKWYIYFNEVNRDGNGSSGGSGYCVEMRQVDNGYVFVLDIP